MSRGRVLTTNLTQGKLLLEKNLQKLNKVNAKSQDYDTLNAQKKYQKHHLWMRQKWKHGFFIPHVISII